MLHIYHGDGKGKTTAAFGLALRQIGQDHQVLIVQFLKQGDSGEMRALKDHPNAELMTMKYSSKFYYQMSEEEQFQCQKAQQDLWQYVAMNITKYDCVILDELLDVLGMQLLDEQVVWDVLAQYKGEVEIVVTGRNPSPHLRAMCDYDMEMIAHKHPYQKGCIAREGVEY